MSKAASFQIKHCGVLCAERAHDSSFACARFKQDDEAFFCCSLGRCGGVGADWARIHSPNGYAFGLQNSSDAESAVRRSAGLGGEAKTVSSSRLSVALTTGLMPLRMLFAERRIAKCSVE